jgi:hypothetical protein
MFKATAYAWARDAHVVAAIIDLGAASNGPMMRGQRQKETLGPPLALRDPDNDDVH